MRSDFLEVLPSGARTTTQTGPDQQNDEHDGIRVIVDLTAFVTAAALTVELQGKDPSSGKYYALLTSAVLAAVATTRLELWPGAPVTANVSANGILPGTWRIVVTHGNANSVTYSVGVERIKLAA